MNQKSTDQDTFKTPFSFKIRWEDAFESEEFLKVFSEDILEEYIVKKRWYAGKASTLKYIEIIDYFKIISNTQVYFGVLLEVNFKEAFFQNYFMPLSFCLKEDLSSNTVITPISFDGKAGYIMDALHEEEFRKLLFEEIANATPDQKHEKIQFHKGIKLTETSYQSSRFMGVEQSNTSIIYNDHFVLKIFRRIYINTNPDYEISRFLTERSDFKNTPAYHGSINLKHGEDDTITLGLMQELVPNQGDAWKYMLEELDKVYGNLEYKKIEIARLPEISLFKRLKITDIPPEIIDWAGLNLFIRIKQLALRTAEMHIAMGSEIQDTSFTPSNYNSDYTVWLKNRLIYQFQNRLNTIENNLHKLDGLSLELAQQFLERKKEIRKKFLEFDWTKLKSERIRIHGDYHLGQVLVNGEDFYLLDFEGEPESTIRDRKVKQPPLKDVAGMFRSFHYAIYSTVFNNAENYVYDKNDLLRAGEVLYRFMVGVFLETYIDKAQRENLNIGYSHEIEFLLRYCLLEKAVYELGYELNSRPRWAVIPLEGIASIMNYN
ncbi:trehalose synthase [Flavobacteriaceae bacterium M23B6Z8]